MLNDPFETAHLFRAPLSAWEEAALQATWASHEWFWIDTHESCYTDSTSEYQ